MISLERAKKLINDNSISDEETQRIVDCLYSIANLSFEKWLRENVSKFPAGVVNNFMDSNKIKACENNSQKQE